MLEKGVDLSRLFHFSLLRSRGSNFSGWRFARSDEDIPGYNVMPDPHHSDFTHIRQLYFKVDPEYKGRFTVPILYDYKQGKIVNNEVFGPTTREHKSKP